VRIFNFPRPFSLSLFLSFSLSFSLSLSLSIYLSSGALQVSPSGSLFGSRKQKRVGCNLLGTPLVLDLLLTGLPTENTIFNKKRILWVAEYYIENNILNADIILHFKNLKINYKDKMLFL